MVGKPPSRTVRTDGREARTVKVPALFRRSEEPAATTAVSRGTVRSSIPEGYTPGDALASGQGTQRSLRHFNINSFGYDVLKYE